MRVLIFSRCNRVDARARWMAGLGESLVSRGATVAAVTRKGAVREFFEQSLGDTLAPSLAEHSPVAQWAALRRTARKMKPELVVVDDERDLFMAALACPSRTTLLRRIRVVEDERWSWRSSVARIRSRVLLLAPTTAGDAMHYPKAARLIKAPVSLPVPYGISPRRLSGAQEPVIACFSSDDAAAGALCLRTVAKLRTRRPDLALRLMGDTPRMQSLRIHAAALGLVDQVRVAATSELFAGAARDLTAVWITARGDSGALAAVAAMSRGIPVLVDRRNDVASLVAHQITGFLVDEGDLSSTVALFSQLLADSAAQQSMSDAAVARAQRLHAWSVVVDRVIESIDKSREQVKARGGRTTAGVPA